MLLCVLVTSWLSFGFFTNLLEVVEIIMNDFILKSSDRNKEASMKKIVLAIILTCVSSIPALAGGETITVNNVPYYTQVNIHYEAPHHIYSTNYLKGALLPVGTQVTITHMTKETIDFVTSENATFTITLIPEFSLITIDQLFQRTFSATDPRSNNGIYQGFTSEEKDHIDDGIVALGMSKQAVIMSLGYPPEHRTPTLNSNSWLYWKSRFGKTRITFKNDKVVKIE